MQRIANIGDIFPASLNTSITNPGPVMDSEGNALDIWLLAQQQHTAYRKNEILKVEYTAQLQDSPKYGEKLGKMPSWGVVVIVAEAGGIAFDLQRVGPLVATL